MATLRALGFQRVTVRGHYQYKSIGGGFVSAATVTRAKARADVREAREAAVASALERDRRAAVREAAARAREAAPRRPAREPAPAPLPIPRHREAAPRRDFFPVPPPLPPPRLGEISETYRGAFQVVGSFYRYRGPRGHFISREAYLRLPPDRRRRESHYRYAQGGSKRIKGLVDALRMYQRLGVPWEGVPDNYRADAIRLALVEPAEGDGEPADEASDEDSES